MSERARQRAAVLERLSTALAADERLAGAVLVGSGATGFHDDESDIDLVAPVAAAHNPDDVFRDWKERINDVLTVRYRAETAFTEQHRLLVLLCEDRLELDLSFSALESLAVLTPRWRVLWERTAEVTQRLSQPGVERRATGEEAYIWTLNRAVHRAVYASKALRRGQLWKALLLLDELRCRALQLACMAAFGNAFEDVLGTNGVERHVDRLPPETLAELARSLPADVSAAALRHSLSSCVDTVLRHAAVLDGRFGLHRSDELTAVLADHLDGAATKGRPHAAPGDGDLPTP